MIAAGTTPGQSGKLIEIASSVSTLNNILTLRSLIMATEVRSTLEIGMRCAGSCLVFTQSARDRGASPDGGHVAIDPFQRSPFNDSCGLLAVERAGLSSYLDFREDFSSQVLPALIKEKAQCRELGSAANQNRANDWFSKRYSHNFRCLLSKTPMHKRIALVVIWSTKYVRANFVIILQDSTIIASSTGAIVVLYDRVFSLYSPQSFEQIMLNAPSPIHQAEGPVVRLRIPQIFLVFL